jgi:hypothetical protein
LTRLEDINPESVASWSASLYSLSIHPHDLSANDVRAVTAIANTTLANALSLGVQKYQGIVGVLQATDAVASLLRYNYNPNSYDDPDFAVAREYINNSAAEVIPVVRSFGDLVSGAQVLGEPRADLLYENFMLSSVLITASNGQPISSPQLAAEEAAMEPTSTITLHPATTDQARVLAVTLVTMEPRAYTNKADAYVSTPIALQLQLHGDGVGYAASGVSEIAFTFQHNEPQDHYVHYTSANLTTTCTERNASQQFSFVCPDSGHVLRHNCSRGAGVQTSYCPRPASACARLDYLSAGISLPTTCNVTAYSATYTTCRCEILSGSGARRLSAQSTSESILDQSGASDMMVSTVYIASNFADTFNSADDLNSPGAVSKVLVVILMLGTLWMPALLFMGFDGLKLARDKPRKTRKPRSMPKPGCCGMFRRLFPVSTLQTYRSPPGCGMRSHGITRCSACSPRVGLTSAVKPSAGC